MHIGVIRETIELIDVVLILRSKGPIDGRTIEPGYELEGICIDGLVRIGYGKMLAFENSKKGEAGSRNRI
jgi:hypothetical protein